MSKVGSEITCNINSVSIHNITVDCDINNMPIIDRFIIGKSNRNRHSNRTIIRTTKSKIHINVNRTITDNINDTINITSNISGTITMNCMSTININRIGIRKCNNTIKIKINSTSTIDITNMSNKKQQCPC